MDSGHLIVETGPGWVCANAGVDESNSGDPNIVVLLPTDPDASARRIAAAAHQRYRCDIAVIVTDTFGRPWRQGLVDFALGVAGMPPLLDLRGSTDLDGRTLKHTIAAQADALAAAAGLVMRKGDAVPAAVVRGYDFEPGEGSGLELIREKQFDLFR
jgi:coenzyme F420-0:L-glutamate ligase/coenzyme F420-1:gamma-L-glutamate ligase